MATTMTIAEFLAAGAYDGEYVIADTAVNFAALSEADIGTIGAAGVAVSFDVTDDAATVSVPQVQAMVTAGIAFAAGDAITLQATATEVTDANGELVAFRQAGVDVVDVTTGTADLYARGGVLDAIFAGLTFADPITISDDDDYLRTLTPEQVQALADAGVGTIATTDSASVLAVSYDWWATALDAGLTLVGTIRIAEAGDVLATRDFAALYAAGIRSVLAFGDFPVTLAAFDAFINSGLMFYGDTMSIADTGANITALPPGDLDTLQGLSISAFAATDGPLTLSLDFYNQLANRGFTLGGESIVELTDAEFPSFDIFGAASRGVDAIGAADGSLNVSLEQAGWLRDAGLVFAADDAITVELTLVEFDALSAQDIADLATGGVDIVDLDGAAATVSLTQVEAMVDAGLAFAAGDVVTLAGTAADLAAASGDFLAFVEAGIDVIDVTSGTLSLYARGGVLEAIDAGLTFADPVTLTDDDDFFRTLTPQQLQALADAGVSTLASTDSGGYFVLSYAWAMSAIAAGLTFEANVVVLEASASDWTDPDFAALADAGIGWIQATGGIALSVADALEATEYFGGGKLYAFAGVLAVVASPDELEQTSAADIASLSTTGGFRAFRASSPTDVFELSIDQATALRPFNFPDGYLTIEIQSDDDLSIALGDEGTQFVLWSGMTFADDFVTTLTGTASNLPTLLAAYFQQIAASGADVIECTNGTAVLSVEQATTLADGGVAFDGTFRLVVDTDGAAYDAASAAFADLATAGIDEVGFSGGAMSLTLVQVQAAIDAGLVFAAGDDVTLADTGADIAGLSAADIAVLAAVNIDAIDVTDDAVTLSLATYQAIVSAGIGFAADDAITLELTQAEFAGLSAQDIADLAAAGIVAFGSTGEDLTASLAQVEAMLEAGVTFTADAAVILAGTAASLSSASDDFLAFRQAGVDEIDVTSGTLDVLLRGSVLDAIRAGLTFADPITVHDDDDYFRALDLADFQMLAEAGVTILRGTENDFSVGFALANAIAAAGLEVSVTNNRVITATGSEVAGADLQALSASAFNAFDIAGPLQLSVQQALALVADFLTWNSGSTWTIETDQAAMDGLSAAQIASFRDGGFNTFTTNGADPIEVTLDQAVALTAYAFSGGLSVEIQSGGPFSLAFDDTARAIFDHGDITFADDFVATLTANASTLAQSIATYYDEIAGSGIDVIACTSDTAVLSLTQADTLADAGITFSGTFQLVVDAAEYGQASASFADLAAAGIDEVGFSGGAAALTVAEVEAAIDAGLVFADGDTITLADTGANIAALDVAAIAALAAANVDAVDATDDAVALSLATFTALLDAGIALAAADTVTLHLTASEFDDVPVGTFYSDFAQRDVDVIDIVGGAPTVSLAQAVYLSGAGLVFAAADTVTLAASAADLQDNLLLIDDVASAGVDVIEVVSGTLEFTSVSAIFSVIDLGATFVGSVVLRAGGAALAELTGEQLQSLAAAGVVGLGFYSGGASWTLAQVQAVIDAGLVFAAGDTVTVDDTGAAIAALSAADIAALAAANVDGIDASDDAVSFDLDQIEALRLAGIALTADDTVTLILSQSDIYGPSSADLQDYAAMGVDFVAASGGLQISLARIEAIIDAGLAFADTSTVALWDAGASIGALSAADIATLGAAGVDTLGTTEALTMSLAQVAAAFDAGMDFDVGGEFRLTDAASTIAALAAGELADLAAAGVDVLHTTSDGIALTAAEALVFADAGIPFLDGDLMIVADTAASILALSAADLAALGDVNFDVLNAGGASDVALSATLAFAQAALDAGLTFTGGDTVTVVDTAENIAALSAADIAALAAAGVDDIEPTEPAALDLTTDQALAIVDAGFVFDGGNTVTVSDELADIRDLIGTGGLAALAAAGFDSVGVVEDGEPGALTITLADFNEVVGAGLRFAADTSVTFDDPANVATFMVEPHHFANYGIDVFVTDVAVSGNLAAVVSSVILGLTYEGEVYVTGSDTSFGNLTAGDWTSLRGAGIDGLDLGQGGDLALGAATVASLAEAGMVLRYADSSLTISDTGAAIAALTADEFAAIGDVGTVRLDATNDAVTVSLAQAQALAGAGLSFDASDTVTMTGAAADVASLSSSAITALAAAGIDRIDFVGGPVTLSLAQASGLTGAGLVFAAADAVTTTLTAAQAVAASAADLDGLRAAGVDTLVVADTGAALAGLSTTQIAALAAKDIDGIDATNDSLVLSVAKADAFIDAGFTFVSGDAVIVDDTAANIGALSTAEIAALRAAGVDGLSSVSDALSLTLAQLDALASAGLSIDAGDVLTIADTGASLKALTTAQIATLDARGVDRIDATDNALSLSLAQSNAFANAGIALTATDTVTLADAGATLAGVSATVIAGRGVDRIDATDNALSLSLAQSSAFANAGIALTATDTVTLADAGATLAGLSVAAIAGRGVDRIDATDNALSLSLAQSNAFANAGIALTAADTVTLADAGATLAGVSAAVIAGLGVDRIDATDNALSLSLAQSNAFASAGIALTGADTVTLADAGATLAGLSVAAIAGRGVDRIDATDNALSLSLAQSNAFANVGIALTAADTITLADAAATLAGLSVDAIAVIAGRGVDRIDATDNALSLSLAQSNAFAAAGIALTAADAITLADAGATLSALSVDAIAVIDGRGIERVDATDNALSLGLAQSNAFANAGIALAADDTITLADAGATLAGLSVDAIAVIAGRGIERVDATDNALSLGLAQSNAYAAAGIALAADDTITLADGGAALGALSATQIADLAARGIDRLDATDNAVAFSVSDLQALAANGIALSGGDTITLRDGAAAISTLSAAQIEALTGSGLDRVDVLGNAVTLSIARYDAFDGVRFAAGDTVTVTGTSEADVIRSSGADTVFDGNGGRDRLVGGAGEDVFRFDTRLGSDQVDTILSFNVKADSFALDDAVFKALKSGLLSARAFEIGTAADDAADRIIYDKKTGALYYDADGDGAGAAVRFATVEKGLALDHDDFFVV